MIAAPPVQEYCPNCLKPVLFKSLKCSCEGKKKALVYKGNYVDLDNIHKWLRSGKPTLLPYYMTMDLLLKNQELKAFVQDYIPYTAIENLRLCKLITVNTNIKYENKMGE